MHSYFGENDACSEQASIAGPLQNAVTEMHLAFLKQRGRVSWERTWKRTTSDQESSLTLNLNVLLNQIEGLPVPRSHLLNRL